MIGCHPEEKCVITSDENEEYPTCEKIDSDINNFSDCK